MILNLTPCPLVIPEPMFSGLPVLLSDAVIGRLEMIDPGESGYPVIRIPVKMRIHSRPYSARFCAILLFSDI